MSKKKIIIIGAAIAELSVAHREITLYNILEGKYLNI